jgi:hypothetical protein
MSAKIIEAFEAEAHRLDAEADNADPQGADNGRPALQRELAAVLRNLALRSQGTDPAARAAEDFAAADQGNPAGGGGLAVDKTDAETGEPV